MRKSVQRLSVCIPFYVIRIDHDGFGLNRSETIVIQASIIASIGSIKAAGRPKATSAGALQSSSTTMAGIAPHAGSVMPSKPAFASVVGLQHPAFESQPPNSAGRDRNLLGTEIQPSLGFLDRAEYVSGAAKNLVSRTGFEPVAYGLGNRCSILLSYRDIPRTKIVLPRPSRSKG
jgi:hypothetical protein